MHKLKFKFKAAPRGRCLPRAAKRLYGEAALLGFTLIELLVVIAVIALLVTLSILALSNARTAARDSKRVADIKQMQTALEMFYDANNRYPTSAEFQTGRLAYFDSKTGTTTFITIPSAPTPADGSCTDATNAYNYVPSADGSSYALNFCTAKKINDIPAGTLAATPGGIISVAPPTPPAFSAQHLAFVGDDSTLINYPYSVFVSGNYAYVVNYFGNSLEIVDISDPAHPVHKGNIFSGDGGAKITAPRSVYVVGNYAYIVSSDSNALEIVDVSNPAAPRHSGYIVDNYQSDPSGPALGSPVSVFVSGHYAYAVGTTYDSFEIMDISSSTNPVHVGKLVSTAIPDDDPYFRTPTSVFVSGNYAYVTSQTGHKLEVINVSDPANPHHAGKITDGDEGPDGGNANLNDPISVYVSGNYAYVASHGSSAMEIVNVSDPTNPTHKGTIWNNDGADEYGQGGALLSSPNSVYVSGNYAYVSSNTSNALEIVDVSDPANPVHKSSLTDGTGGALLHYPAFITVSGNYAYVAGAADHYLEIVDISNPAIPAHKSSYSNTNNIKLVAPRGVYVSGNYAYVTSQSPNNSVQVFDISNPANPAPKGYISDNSPSTPKLASPQSVQVIGDYAYIASQGSSGLEILNISNPNSLAHSGFIGNSSTSTPKLASPYCAYVSGNYAYVVGGNNGLEILNIFNPGSPVHSGFLPNGNPTSATKLNGGRSVQVVGNYAYVASYTSNAVEIVNITTSSAPTHVISLVNADVSGSGGSISGPWAVFVTGNYAYVANSTGNSLEILDITDPTHPTHKGLLTNGAGGALLSKPQAVFVSGNYAYVASYNSNAVEIVDVSDPAHPTHKTSVVNGVGGAKLYQPYALYVSGNYVYVADYGSKGLEVISLSGN